MNEAILQSLDIMWKGMFSIFSVIIIITLSVIIFQWFERTFIKDKKTNE